MSRCADGQPRQDHGHRNGEDERQVHHGRHDGRRAIDALEVDGQVVYREEVRAAKEGEHGGGTTIAC